MQITGLCSKCCIKTSDRYFLNKKFRLSSIDLWVKYGKLFLSQISWTWLNVHFFWKFLIIAKVYFWSPWLLNSTIDKAWFSDFYLLMTQNLIYILFQFKCKISRWKKSRLLRLFWFILDETFICKKR